MALADWTAATTNNGTYTVVSEGGSMRMYAVVSSATKMHWLKNFLSKCNAEIKMTLKREWASVMFDAIFRAADIDISAAIVVSMRDEGTVYYYKVIAGVWTEVRNAATGIDFSTYQTVRIRVFDVLTGVKYTLEHWTGGVWVEKDFWIDNTTKYLQGVSGLYGFGSHGHVSGGTQKGYQDDVVLGEQS